MKIIGILRFDNMRMKVGFIMEGEGIVFGKSNDKRWIYYIFSNLWDFIIWKVCREGWFLIIVK